MKKTVSILIPCFNEQDSLPLLYKALFELMETPKIAENYNFEVLFINDGSKDSTLAVMRQLHKQDSRINYLSFASDLSRQL